MYSHTSDICMHSESDSPTTRPTLPTRRDECICALHIERARDIFNSVENCSLRKLISVLRNCDCGPRVVFAGRRLPPTLAMDAKRSDKSQMQYSVIHTA